MPRQDTSTGGSGELLTVATEQQHGFAVVSLGGELDLASIPRAEPALDALSANNIRGLIFDLRRLHFIDSSGLRFILKAAQLAREREWRFSVVRGGEQVQRVLEATGLDQELPLADDPSDVIDAGG